MLARQSGYVPRMLLLLGCAIEQGEPAQHPQRRVSDTADVPSDNEPCASPGDIYEVPTGGTLFSPYANLITVDLDGRGWPDVLHETFDPVRSVSLLRGEDVATGVLTPSVSFPVSLLVDQAALTVGVAGDLDGDGAHEVTVGQVGMVHGEGQLDIWALADSTTPMASVTLFASSPENWSFVAPLEGAGPDLDGDGIPEVVVTALVGQQLGVTYIYSGATLAGGGKSFDTGDALSEIGDDESYWASRAVVAPDLDGDGVREFLLTHLDRQDRGDVRVAPPDLVGAGGVVSPDDLDVLISLPNQFMPPMLVDLNEDGVPELFASDGGVGANVRGFTGDMVVSAAREGRALTKEEAWVKVTGAGEDYLGVHIMPVTDDDCAVGLALSAHFADEVRLVANADLLAGGTIQGDSSPTLTGTGDWFGYVLAGGQDLDFDGTLDLVAAGHDGGEMNLYLSPADAAER